jgi:hypothetical protein
MPLQKSDIEVVDVIAIGISKIVDKQPNTYERVIKRLKRHKCNYPNCEKYCPITSWACKKCWMKLPRHLQIKLFDEYVLPMEMGCLNAN